MNLLLAMPVPLMVSAALIVIFTIAVTNARSFPRLQLAQPLPAAELTSSSLKPILAEPMATLDDYAQLPPVAILIPARNEAKVIATTVTSLLQQDYPHLQLLVLDDHSDDGTAAAAQCAAGTDPRFHLLDGRPLPPGWMGKNWACHQLAEAAGLAAASASRQFAEPDILVFTDADVLWQPGAVGALVAEFQRSSADLLTIWPTQITVTWGERLTVPLMALAVLGYLPLRLAHDFYHPLASAANGQCMAFRHAAYAAIGGHAAVRGAVVEDVRLAQHIKAAGLKLRMADGNQLLRCRMYDGWHAVLDGYAKNILAGHGNHAALLLLSTVFHWAVFIWPWLWLAAGSLWALPAWPIWPALLVALGIGARAVTAAATRQRTRDAVLMPLSVVLMTWIAARALWWRWRFGGVVWKGRILRDA
ncbi:MAG: glycosyltransferase [Caldilineaceae bacterium]